MRWYLLLLLVLSAALGLYALTNWNLIVNHCIKVRHTLLKTPLDKDACHKNLITLHDTFAMYGVLFWLSEGTALGFVRGGDFIEHDDDLDIGIWDEDRERFVQQIIPELINQGFTYAFSKLNGTFYTLHRYGEKVDVDVTGPNNMCAANEDRCAKLIPYLQNLQSIQIGTRWYNVPDVGYLEYLYGPNWRTPIRGQKVYK